MNNIKKTFRFRERSFLLGSRTYIMGIINVTPDSFSDGGDNLDPQNALNSAIEMKRFGADILDIGAQSTRPGHTIISPYEEWKRLEYVLPLILNKTSLPISVDTFYPEVAQKALELGCHIINDVSGKVNPEMAKIIKKYSAGWVLMHADSEQDCDICATVHDRLFQLMNSAIELGIDREYICLDPGIGFSKTMEQNFALIAGTDRVKVQGNGYLLGASRKRIIGEALGADIDFKLRDFGTVAAHTIGVMGGADILRVHNVEGAVQAARVVDRILKKRI